MRNPHLSASTSLPLGKLPGILLFVTSIFLAELAKAQALPTPTRGPVPQAPPPAPPIMGLPQSPPPDGSGPRPLGLTLYSIGQPTDEEQLYLEYINRARANPTAEGARLAAATDPQVTSTYTYFGVDLNLMQQEFATNPPVPPLAMNAQLLAAARVHSTDMFNNMFQGHNGTDGSNPGTRIAAQGYNASSWGENVYAYAESVFYGHAGLAVDWGNTPGAVGGMQNPPGHRNNMLSSGFREVGIGVVDGVNGPVGPQLVTQDFGTQSAPAPLISGVVYYDFNGEGFYDVGEGIGGVTVTVPGSSYYAITADSGGFAVPVTTSGTYTVTFTAPGLSQQMVATVSSQKNVKVDFVPIYTPPVVSGPNPAVLNQSNLFSFTVVGGATNYQWQESQLQSYTLVEGAENGLGDVTIVSSPGYSVLSSDLVASGSYAFHLAQPDQNPQSLTLNALLLPSSTSQLSFAKLLGWASSTQVAHAQVSSDGGSHWVDLWTEAGSDAAGDSTFSTISVPLSDYAGQTIQIRFLYDLSGGSYFNQTDPGVGLYLDDIAVSDAQQLLNQATNGVTGSSFYFYPTSTGNFLLQVRALINSRTLGWGPALNVTVAAGSTPVIHLGQPSLSGGQIKIDLAVANYSTGMTFQLWKAASPASAWSLDNSATLQTIVAGSQYRFTTSAGPAASGFYRVLATY